MSKELDLRGVPAAIPEDGVPTWRTPYLGIDRTPTTAQAIEWLKRQKVGVYSTIYFVQRYKSRTGDTEQAQAFCIDVHPDLSIGRSRLTAVGREMALALGLVYEVERGGGGIVFKRNVDGGIARQMGVLARLLGVRSDDLRWEWL